MKEKKILEPMMAPGNRSDAQWANDRKIIWLGKALGIYATDADISAYAKVVKALEQGGIGPEEYATYLDFVRTQAEDQGDWTVTLHSLTANGRISQFAAYRRQAAEPSVADLDAMDAMERALREAEEVSPEDLEAAGAMFDRVVRKFKGERK